MLRTLSKLFNNITSIVLHTEVIPSAWTNMIPSQKEDALTTVWKSTVFYMGKYRDQWQIISDVQLWSEWPGCHFNTEEVIIAIHATTHARNQPMYIQSLLLQHSLYPKASTNCEPLKFAYSLCWSWHFLCVFDSVTFFFLLVWRVFACFFEMFSWGCDNSQVNSVQPIYQ